MISAEELRNVKENVIEERLHEFSVIYNDLIKEIEKVLITKAENSSFPRDTMSVTFSSPRLNEMPDYDIESFIHYMESYGFELEITCDDEAGSIGLYEAIPETGEVKIIWQGE